MDTDHLAEMFSAFGPVSIRRMFGGAGVYADGTMFALVHDGTVYLKADDRTIATFEQERQHAFTYTAKNGKRAVMSYWSMPERLYDDPEDLACWARDALQAARRSSISKVKSRR